MCPEGRWDGGYGIRIFDLEESKNNGLPCSVGVVVDYEEYHFCSSGLAVWEKILEGLPRVNLASIVAGLQKCGDI